MEISIGLLVLASVPTLLTIVLHFAITDDPMKAFRQLIFPVVFSFALAVFIMRVTYPDWGTPEGYERVVLVKGAAVGPVIPVQMNEERMRIVPHDELVSGQYVKKE